MGFDAVKVGFCGGTAMHLAPSEAYGAFRDALPADGGHRPMLFNICNPFTPGAAGPGDPPPERTVDGPTCQPRLDAATTGTVTAYRKEPKTAAFTATRARYVRLTATSTATATATDGGYDSAAGIRVRTAG